MALTGNEASRLADMAAALRPEWNARSVRHWLETKATAHTYQDLAFALVAAALDERCQTQAAALHAMPLRVAGAARRAMSETTVITPREPGEDRCPVVGHETMPRQGCPSCAADAKARQDEEEAGPPPLHLAADFTATHTLCGQKIRPGMRVAVRGRPLVSEAPHPACLAAVDPQVECVPVPATTGGES